MNWSVTAGIVLMASATILLIVALIIRPALADSVPGNLLSFLALFILPVGVAFAGFQHHMEVSKTTRFCLSCHVMKAHGDSLAIDDNSFLVAAHYQNNRIPRDEACYTCHTNYAMFGGMKAKLNGFHHIWVQITGQIPDELELYEPYRNRECLHCHNGARSFEESSPHDIMLEELRSNDTSCLDCHDQTHGIDGIEARKKWKGGAEG